MTHILSDDTEQSDSETHGLANMALLSRPANSALNSSAFVVKRNMILDLDKDGSFVPICTRRVFQGYYTGNTNNGDDAFFWGTHEQGEYITEIIKLIKVYLPETAASCEGGGQ